MGGVTSEHIQFNEGTLRKGKPHEYQHADAAKPLPRVRELCNESRSLWLEARALEKQGKKTEAAAKDKASRAKQKGAEDPGRQSS